MTALGVNQFYDGSTVLEPLSKATDLPIDQVGPVCYCNIFSSSSLRAHVAVGCFSAIYAECSMYKQAVNP